MSICIFASELAIITGHNKYQNLNEYILKLWKKTFPYDYQEHLDLYSNKNNVEIVQQTPEEKLLELSKKHNVNINECLNAKDTKTLQTTQNSILKQLKEKDPKIDLTELKKCVQQVTNTNFGTKNEKNSLNQYNTKTQKNIATTNKFFKKEIFTTKKYKWLIGGKIDGLDEDEDTIIEFKNRVNRLFYKLRDYEKVQTMTYMFLLEKNNSRLVETLKNSGDTQMNVIEVAWDSDFWENEIIEKLKSFSKEFEKLMNSSKKKLKFLEETLE